MQLALMEGEGVTRWMNCDKYDHRVSDACKNDLSLFLSLILFFQCITNLLSTSFSPFFSRCLNIIHIFLLHFPRFFFFFLFSPLFFLSLFLSFLYFPYLFLSQPFFPFYYLFPFLSISLLLSLSLSLSLSLQFILVLAIFFLFTIRWRRGVGTNPLYLPPYLLPLNPYIFRVREVNGC